MYSNPIEQVPFDGRLLSKIRSKFPRIDSDTEGPRIFFDNGAGSLVLKSAADAEHSARIDFSANKGARFTESKVAGEIIVEGRSAVRDLLNAPENSLIISGESSSDLLFKISYAISKNLSEQDNVVSTFYEHYASITPYVELQRRGRIKEVRIARVNKEDGTLDLTHLRSLVDQRTKVVVVTGSSNVLGSKSPLKEVNRIAHKTGALVVVDAVHHVPQGPVDVQDIDCDFLAFSGYKTYGPHGGFAYVSPRALQEVEPYHVDPKATPESPSKFELGTRDQARFSAIKAVVEYFEWLSREVAGSGGQKPVEGAARSVGVRTAMEAMEKYGQSLSKMVLSGVDGVAGLAENPNVILYGNHDPKRVAERDATFSFKLPSRKDEEVVDILWNKYRIAMRSGNYFSNAHELYEMPSMLRITLLHYNTPKEVVKFLKAIADITRTS